MHSANELSIRSLTLFLHSPFSSVSPDLTIRMRDRQLSKSDVKVLASLSQNAAGFHGNHPGLASGNRMDSGNLPLKMESCESVVSTERTGDKCVSAQWWEVHQHQESLGTGVLKPTRSVDSFFEEVDLLATLLDLTDWNTRRKREGVVLIDVW
jgi:hypothetical protein